ncbi:Hypothetical protein GSB_16353 [Giardia duodenalis]|uniref:Uncharacterized protein n=2 Tax=Giardia intestinalis TaxID=5741 RepID=C6LTK7_GIAIB|nr:Hypothetical protein GL50581_2103 [Giardia intestinalis ATCC 50581]ESU44353.1 Hypothetical protein GSB_16353 [Giardia intestinalis]
MIPKTYLNITEKDAEVTVQRMRYNSDYFSTSEFEKVSKMGTVGDLEEIHMIQGTTLVLLVYNGGSKIECCDCITGERFDSMEFAAPITKYVVYPGERSDFRYAYCNATGVVVVRVESNGKLAASSSIALEPKSKILKLAVSSAFVVFAYATKKGVFLSVTNMSRMDKQGILQVQGAPLSLTIGEPESLASHNTDAVHGSDPTASNLGENSSGFQLNFNILRAIFKSSSSSTGPFTLLEYKLKLGDITPNPLFINKIERYSYRDYFDFYSSFVYEGNGPAAAITNLSLHQRPRVAGLERNNASLLQTNFIATEARTYPVFDSSPDLLYFVTATNSKAKTKDAKCVYLYYMGSLERVIQLPQKLQGGDTEVVSVAFSTTYVIFVVIKSKNKNNAGLWAFGSMDVPKDRFILIDKTYQYPINRYMIDRSKRSIVLLMRDRIEYIHSDLPTKYWSFHPRYEDIFSEYSKDYWHFTDSSERHKVKSYSHTGNDETGYHLCLVITIIEENMDTEDETLALPLYSTEFNPEHAKRLLEEEGDVDFGMFDPGKSQKASELSLSHATGHASSTRYTTHSICIDGNTMNAITEEIKNDQADILRHYEEGSIQQQRLDDYNEEELDGVASPEPEQERSVMRESPVPKPIIEATPTIVHNAVPEPTVPAAPSSMASERPPLEPLPESVQPVTVPPMPPVPQPTSAVQPAAPVPEAQPSVVPAPAPKAASPAPAASAPQQAATPQVSQGGSMLPIVALAFAAVLIVYLLKK